MGKNNDRLKNLRNLVNGIKKIDINKEQDNNKEKSMLNESSFDIPPQDNSHIHSENLEDREYKNSSEHVYKKGFVKKPQHTNSVLDYNHDNDYNKQTEDKNEQKLRQLDLSCDNAPAINKQPPKLPPPLKKPVVNKSNIQKNGVKLNQKTEIKNQNNECLEDKIQIELSKCVEILALRNQIEDLQNKLQDKDTELSMILLKNKQIENNTNNDQLGNLKLDEDSLAQVQEKIEQQNKQIQELQEQFQQEKNNIQQNYEEQIKNLKNQYEETIKEQKNEIDKLTGLIEQQNKQEIKFDKIDLQIDNQQNNNNEQLMNQIEEQLKKQNEMLQDIQFNQEIQQIEFKTLEFNFDQKNFNMNDKSEQTINQENINKSDVQVKLQQLQKEQDEQKISEKYQPEQDQDLNIFQEDLKKDDIKELDMNNFNINQETEEKNNEDQKKEKVQVQEHITKENFNKKQNQQKEFSNLVKDQDNQLKNEKEIKNKIEEDLIFKKQKSPQNKIKNLFSKNIKKQTNPEEIFFDQTPEEGTNYLEIFDNLSHNHENFDNINDTLSQQDYYDQNDDLHSLKSLQIGTNVIKSQINPFKKNTKTKRQQKSFKKVQSLKKNTPHAKISNTIPDDLFQFIFIQYYELKNFLRR